MKEHPILFQSEMIQAILTGNKTQTRRVVKPQPEYDQDSGYKYWDNLMFDLHDDVLETMYMPDHCKFGKIGDILWVRETWRLQEPFDYDGEDHPKQYWYYASTPEKFECVDGSFENRDDYKWKSSIFMPKEVCRIRLEITNIRVERLQEITEENAIAEGIGSGFQMNAGWPDYQHIKNGVCELTQDTARLSYVSLWESINDKGSWDLNPWVWVLNFKKL